MLTKTIRTPVKARVDTNEDGEETVGFEGYASVFDNIDLGGEIMTEAMLTEAEERERAFVCAASHDLVTPLMAVTANCDVLEAEAPDRADLTPWLSNIRAAADEMASRIAEMLARMGRGQAR